jgi:hypothetical protein
MRAAAGMVWIGGVKITRISLRYQKTSSSCAANGKQDLIRSDFPPISPNPLRAKFAQQNITV